MPIDKALRPTVRIRILRGALTVGPRTYLKNMSVEVDKEYAEMLVSTSPSDYEIMAIPAPKPIKARPEPPTETTTEEVK